MLLQNDKNLTGIYKTLMIIDLGLGDSIGHAKSQTNGFDGMQSGLWANLSFATSVLQ